MLEEIPANEKTQRNFTGNLYIFHAFDVGDEINLDTVRDQEHIITRSYTVPKFFKNYHMPLEIDLPHPHSSSGCHSVRLHNFGTIALTYKIPFSDTFDNVRSIIEEIDNKYQEQSVIDAANVYKAIKKQVKKPKFFHTKSSYTVIQVDVAQKRVSVDELKNTYGSAIASMLRFEKQALSEYQIQDILSSAIGYFKGDLIIIDTESSFVYDPDYEEILYLFEFANIQALELRFFDRLLDQKLNLIYEEKFGTLNFTSYLPFVGSSTATSPVDELGKLKVDIQVIIERMESSIKLVGEPYFSEIYNMLVDKLDLDGWRNAINQKLEIVSDIKSVIQHKVDSIRGDMLEVLIIILIFIELLVGLWKH